VVETEDNMAVIVSQQGKPQNSLRNSW